MIIRVKAAPGKFSQYIFPDWRERRWDGPPCHLQHRLICCDCGLSHDMELVIVETRRGKMVRVAPRKYAIQFRARRNERSTAQIRRKKQTKV